MVRRLSETSGLVRVADLRQTKSRMPPVADGTPRKQSDSTAYGLTRESWRDFANIGLQVASALEHAHAQGVRHNDMKPANLLLTDRGDVIVTDFGVERRKDTELPKTEDHAMGTLRFMAPECACKGPAITAATFTRWESRCTNW